MWNMGRFISQRSTPIVVWILFSIPSTWYQISMENRMEKGMQIRRVLEFIRTKVKSRLINSTEKFLQNPQVDIPYRLASKIEIDKETDKQDITFL